jgi:methylase of polypeptide subunit release factors
LAANDVGEDALEHRTSAWHRLLSLSRGIHRGIAHDRLRIPAYGGGVFDPDRFPWLEGRRAGDAAMEETRVVPIDDRTVLHALEAVQFVELKGEKRRLTFRTLDVEQIGYVYEGLLGYDAHRSGSPVVGLIGSEGDEPEVELAQLEARGSDLGWLHELTGLSARRIEQALSPRNDSSEREAERLLRAASGGDESLVERVRPYFGLLRNDLRGIPVVVPAGGIYVTASPRRRLSGTHYTPRDLAFKVVEGALEPLVFSPGPLETADRTAWRLRPSRDILALRVVDIAMGSGAFLVAACRYMADKVVEAWATEGNPLAAQRVAETEALQYDAEADPVVIEARRRVIEHCLYGGDINEMAVEMAKLSLWLVSLSRERPFSFLDDRLVCGDSLLGLTSLDQLRKLHLDPKRAARVGEQGLDLWGVVRARLDEVEAIRRELSEHELRDIRDARFKATLLSRADQSIAPLRVIADGLVGAALLASSERRDADDAITQVAFDAGAALRADGEDREALLAEMSSTAAFRLDTDRPPDAFDRRPTHWPLVFPEAFEAGGFDAVVGNPPFLGGKKISGAFGDAYREFLVRHVARGARGGADLLAYFVLVAHAILNPLGQTGLIGTNTLAQGDTREVSLDQLAADGVTIRAAVKSAKWPTRTVNLEYAVLWSSRRAPAEGAGRVLDGRSVGAITTSFDAVSRAVGKPSRLVANQGIAFQGSILLGIGFTMTPEEAARLLEADERNGEVLFPYLNGEDLNQRWDSSPSRWVIDFRDRSESEARAWRECWDWVEQRVKPERMQKDAAKYPKMVDRWWQHWNMRPELFAAVRGLDRVLVISRVAKVVLPLFVPAGIVASDATVVFAYDDDAHLALLSSAFHYWWAITYASTMRTDLRYTPTDVFETFPQPPMTPRLNAAGKALDSFRRALMIERKLGVTSLYNLFHDSKCRELDIQRLREIHAEINDATAETYGWSDLALDHGFHMTRQGVRFTVSETTRTEILDRLLELNHQRQAEEAAGGGKRSRRSRGRTEPAELFEEQLLDAIFGTKK